MMKLLLTAFDPFGGESINPAQEAVTMVPDQIGDTIVIKQVVPTVFGKSVGVVTDAMERWRPDAVLCIGQAGGRCCLTPERIAINVDDASIPDNEGNQPIDTPIEANGESAYFSSLPVKGIVQAIRSIGLPSSVSNTAGTFVCNHLMYGVLHYIRKNGLSTSAGFLHVPFTTRQAAEKSSPTPSMSTEDIARGIAAAIGAIEADRSA